MIVSSSTPQPGSVFKPTTMKGVEETFVSASMRTDVPACEYVKAEFGDVIVTISDLGLGDLGQIQRECTVTAGGVVTDFETVEQDGCASDGSSFGSRTVTDATITRIRRWAATHGIPDTGPARTPRGA